MKKILFYSICILAFCACEKEEYKLYSGTEYIQLDKEYQNDDNEAARSFVYLGSKVTQDTFFMKVFTVGDPKPYRRKVDFKQVKEYNIEYVRDTIFGHIIDTTYTEYLNKAIAGTHYVPFDDPQVLDHYYVEANEFSAELPIILLRDTSLKKKDVRLALQLTDNNDFKTGDTKLIGVTVVFSDQLLKPESWFKTENIAFGKYSKRKHEFMIEVTGEKVDSEWIDGLSIPHAQFYRDTLNKALYEYNNDSENIAKGLAPMREDPNDQNSAVIEFQK